MDDIQVKWDRIRAWLTNRHYDGLLLTSQTSFSWLTGGRAFIGLATENACAKILVSNDKIRFIVNNIENARLFNEEIRNIPCEIHSFEWFDPTGEQHAIQACIGSQRIAWEKDALNDMILLRSPLTKLELNRYHRLGNDLATAIEQTCMNFSRGDTEFKVAALLAENCIQNGIDPIVNLVAGDERVFRYRHPLPTNRSIDQYAMLAVGGRRNGLVASVSRLVHFGSISDELKRKQEAAAEVDATFIALSRPGNRVADIFKEACQVYEKWGFPDEWKHHHQGGMTGYVSREYRATPDSMELIGLHQAFSWNPSISGVKSEDTIIVNEKQNEMITRTGNFPEIVVEKNGIKLKRPAILQRRW